MFSFRNFSWRQKKPEKEPYNAYKPYDPGSLSAAQISDLIKAQEDKKFFQGGSFGRTGIKKKNTLTRQSRKRGTRRKTFKSRR